MSGTCREHGDIEGGGWHCSCLDQTACQRRVRQAHKEKRAEKSASADIEPTVNEQLQHDGARGRTNRELLEAIARFIESDADHPKGMRTNTARMVRMCRVVAVRGFTLELEAPNAFAQRELLRRRKLVHTAAAVCMSESWEEYEQVKLVVNEPSRSAA